MLKHAGQIVFNNWLVDLVAYQFEELSESLLISSSSGSGGQIEVDFRQVHTNSSWDVIFK